MPARSDLADGLARPALAQVRPYEPGRPVDDVMRERGIASAVKLASNEGPFAPMPGAIEAIRRAASDVRLYPDSGSWALRDALSARLGVGAENVLVGAGIDGIIGSLAALMLDPGDELAMPWPSFISWRQRAAVAGARVRDAGLAPDGSCDLDALAAAVGPRTKLAVVVSPNNPTGAAVAAESLAEFLDDLPEHVLPVIDEAYFEYLPGDGHDGVALLREGRRVAVLRTFSKAYGLAGLRVGYLAGPSGLVAALGKVRHAFDVNALAQAAALASLGEARQHLPERIALTRGERDRVAKGLRALGLPPFPSTANFLLVDVGSSERAAALNAGLLDRGVIVRPAGPFGAAAALRMTIGWPEENDRLLEALGELREAGASPR